MPTPKTRNILLFILAALLLAAGGVALWFKGNYKQVIKARLPELSAKSTDSLYQIFTGDVDLDVTAGTITFTDLELKPNTRHFARLRADYRLPPVMLSIKIPKLTIEGVSWMNLLRGHLLECDLVKAVNPDIHIQRLGGEPKEKDTAAEPRIQNIVAKRIVVENPHITYEDATTKNKTTYELKGGGIWLQDWRFNLEGHNDTTRLFYASRAAFQFNAFQIHDPAALYRMSSGAITFNDSTNGLTVSKLSIRPALSRADFYKRVGYQKEIYDVSFPSLTLHDLSWQRLVYRGELVATSGALRDASIDIYMDRVPPPNTESKNGKFPHQMLRKLKLPVHLSRLDVENGKFTYTERNYKTREEGTVRMNAIHGAVTHITNMPAAIRAEKVCVVSLSARFKESPIQATFRFPLDAKNGHFSVAGKLDAMDGTRLNDILKPLALAEIRSLKLKEVSFEIQGSESGAKGTLTMLYDDLKVSLLEPEDGSMDKKDVTSFLANHLLTFPRNPMHKDDVRTVHPEVARDATKSFFNLVWKTMFTGILQTASRKLIKLDKMVDKKQRKDEEKRKEETGAGKK